MKFEYIANGNKIFAAACSLLFGCTVFAGLSFDAQKIKETVSPLTVFYDFKFCFTNTGTGPVRIIELKKSCTCIAAPLEKSHYMQNEDGVICGQLLIAGKSGRVVQRLEIVTDETENPSYFLEIELDIPQFASMLPKLLVWRKLEEPESKKLAVSLNKDYAAKLVSVKSDSDNIAARVLPESDGDGGSYVVEVAPLSTELPGRFLVTAEILTTDGKVRRLFSHAIIK